MPPEDLSRILPAVAKANGYRAASSHYVRVGQDIAIPRYYEARTMALALIENDGGVQHRVGAGCKASLAERRRGKNQTIPLVLGGNIRARG